MTRDIQRLVAVSRALGGDAGAVQGGGGNTSLKLDDGAMLVKASGRALGEVDAESGFVAVDWRGLAASLPGCADEAAYGAALAGHRRAGEVGRPSIETGFHALLGRCVLHGHSVWANLLACAEEGRGLVAQLFPDAGWVDYATPGVALMQAMGAARQEVIFLQNHGLIVSGDDPDSAYARHEAVVAAIRAAFARVPEFGADLAHVPVDGLLFPDQAVYLVDPVLAESRAGRETMAAYAWLRTAIPAAGLTVRFIDAGEQAVLLGMESEKFRQRLVAR